MHRIYLFLFFCFLLFRVTKLTLFQFFRYFFVVLFLRMISVLSYLEKYFYFYFLFLDFNFYKNFLTSECYIKNNFSVDFFLITTHIHNISFNIEIFVNIFAIEHFTNYKLQYNNQKFFQSYPPVIWFDLIWYYNCCVLQ